MFTREECEAMAPEGWVYLGCQEPGERNDWPLRIYMFMKKDEWIVTFREDYFSDVLVVSVTTALEEAWWPNWRGVACKLRITKIHQL